MRIGVYSGSFNPVHKGHVALADYLVQQSLVDEVWLIRTPLNPLKAGAELMGNEERRAMLELAIEGHEGLRVSDVEDDLPLPNYTICTLRRLQELHPDKEFFLVIGADNWQIFNKWKDWQVILRDFHVIVYPRPGYPLPEEGIKYSTVQWVDAPMFNISSTEIRQRLKLGQSLSDWVDIKVEKFLHHVIAKD